MTSNRPYLIRAIYDWLVDNGQTPYLLVDVGYHEVQVPNQFIENGRIVLNISPGAVSYLQIGNDTISFSARFKGVVEAVSFSPDAVIGIYAKESGQGMLFTEEIEQQQESKERNDAPAKPVKRPTLKLIK